MGRINGKKHKTAGECVAELDTEISEWERIIDSRIQRGLPPLSKECDDLYRGLVLSRHGYASMAQSDLVNIDT